MIAKMSEQPGITNLEFHEIQILLSEKRTAHTTFRSGVVVSVLPLTIISFLIASSSHYHVAANWMLFFSVLFGCCTLFLLGGYLIIRGLSRIKFHDSKVSEMLARNPELATIF